jgi:serine/threonine protein kinase
VTGDLEKNKLVFVDKKAHSFDLEDLLRASAEILGKGSIGTAYKAVLEDGTIVAVKRLKDVVTSAKREFEMQIEEVGRMQHVNLVPLRAYYFSKDEKLLVFDFMPMGSVAALLHGIMFKPLSPNLTTAIRLMMMIQPHSDELGTL